MSSRFRGWKLSACGAAAIVAAACGGESNSGEASNTGGTGAPGGTGGSGSSPSAGGAGYGGTGGNATTGTGGSATGGASVGTGGASPAACDQAPCEGVTLLGQVWPACCMSATQCGVDLMGNCWDPAAIQQAIGDAGGFFQPEVIVTDPACSGGTVNLGMGSVALDGCCDSTGVCGLSTENIPAFMGFQVPAMCVTSAESQGAVQGSGIEAGAEVPCAYPDAG